METVIYISLLPVFTAICVLVLRQEVRRSEKRSNALEKKADALELNSARKVDEKNCEERREKLFEVQEVIKEKLESFKTNTLTEFGELKKQIGEVIVILNSRKRRNR